VITPQRNNYPMKKSELLALLTQVPDDADVMVWDYEDHCAHLGVEVSQVVRGTVYLGTVGKTKLELEE